MKVKLDYYPLLFTLFIISCGQKQQTTVANTSATNIEIPKKEEVLPTDLPKAVEVSIDTPGEVSTPRIYLTIDDGPSPFSDEILEVANEKNCKMTVFLVGSNMWNKKYRESLNQYRNNLFIEIANHSYSHAKGKYAAYYKNPNGVLLDFYKNIVQMQLPNSLARLPGRSFWALGNKELMNQESGKHAARLLRQKGFQLFGWDVEWFYHPKTGAPKGTAESVFAEIQKALKQNKLLQKVIAWYYCMKGIFKINTRLQN